MNQHSRLNKEISSQEVIDYLLGNRATNNVVDQKMKMVAEQTAFQFSKYLQDFFNRAVEVHLSNNENKDLANKQLVLVQTQYGEKHLPGAIVLCASDASKMVALSLGCNLETSVVPSNQELSTLELLSFDEIAAKSFLGTGNHASAYHSKLCPAANLVDEKLEIFRAGKHSDFDLEIKIDTLTFEVKLFVPHSILLLAQATPQSDLQSRSADSLQNVRIPEVKLAVTGRLEVTTISLETILNLKLGQILTCVKPKNEPVIIQLGDEDKFYCEFGRIKEQNALRIIRPIESAKKSSGKRTAHTQKGKK